MNDPNPAAEDNGEAAAAAPGAEPELSYNPHMGHLVEPEGDDEPAPDAEKDKAKEGDSPSPGEGDTEPKPDDEPSDKKAKRIEELAYENRRLQRELKEAKEAKPEEDDDTPLPEDDEPLKTLKDFDYDEQKFNRYLIEKGAELADKRRAQKAAEKEKATERTEAQKRQDEFDARVEAFDADHPGFKDRLHADDLKISREMAAFIADPDSEVGFHVGDYLSQNKEEAAKIADMSPTQQMREMTKLEAKIGKEIAKANAEKKKASTAPEPPANPVDGTDPGTDLNPADPAQADKMSDEEWLAARNKQVHGK